METVEPASEKLLQTIEIHSETNLPEDNSKIIIVGVDDKKSEDNLKTNDENLIPAVVLKINEDNGEKLENTSKMTTDQNEKLIPEDVLKTLKDIKTAPDEVLKTVTVHYEKKNVFFAMGPGENGKFIRCPFCEKKGFTNVRRRMTKADVIIICSLCALCAWPLLLCFLLIEPLKYHWKYHHFCAHCNAYLGRYRR